MESGDANSDDRSPGTKSRVPIWSELGEDRRFNLTISTNGTRYLLESSQTVSPRRTSCQLPTVCCESEFSGIKILVPTRKRFSAWILLVSTIELTGIPCFLASAQSVSPRRISCQIPSAGCRFDVRGINIFFPIPNWFGEVSLFVCAIDITGTQC